MKEKPARRAKFSHEKQISNVCSAKSAKGMQTKALEGNSPGPSESGRLRRTGTPDFSTQRRRGAKARRVRKRPADGRVGPFCPGGGGPGCGRAWLSVAGTEPMLPWQHRKPGAATDGARVVPFVEFDSSSYGNACPARSSPGSNEPS